MEATAAVAMATMAEQTTRRITETEVAYKRSKTLRATERARERKKRREHTIEGDGIIGLCALMA